MKRRIQAWLAMAAILAVSLGCLLGVFAWVEDRCQRAGGHVVAVSRGWLCVSQDGRVIEP